MTITGGDSDVTQTETKSGRSPSSDISRIYIISRLSGSEASGWLLRYAPTSYWYIRLDLCLKLTDSDRCIYQKARKTALCSIPSDKPEYCLNEVA